jgi:murein DD-endopeptidase MepM/ murein hydrolase activator NlpD
MVLDSNRSVVQHIAFKTILVFTSGLKPTTAEGPHDLLQFTSPRTRVFRRRGIGLRHAVFPVLALGMVYACIAGGPEQTEVSVSDSAAANAAIAAAVPAPNAIPVEHSESLKSAFELIPATPSYSYAPRAEDAPVPKPQVAAAQPSALSKQLASIQTGITKILESSGDSASQKKLSVGKGDTLMDILVRNKIPREEAYSAILALSKVYDPRDLKDGRAITVFFHRDPAIADPKFAGLRIERDTVNSVVVNRADDGSFKVNQEAKTVHRELKAVRGKIENSLYVDAQAQGLPDSVILDLIKLYSFGVDFQRELHGGDTYEVLYEEYVTDDGSVVPGKGNVVYAKLGLSDRMMPLYRYEEKSGDVEYFDPTGQSAKKPLMKTPVDGARMSSGFGMRFHPVLGYNKMHKGIDFAAPRGTPIYAAGDGVVEKAGKFSSYGNYVRLRHRAGLETAYAHMQGFHAGIKPGVRVKQGQVIGYIGTTGRSTGPHLHYEILIGGTQVNPASVKLAGGRSLGGKDLKAFKQIVNERNAEFEKASHPAAANVAAADVAHSRSN